MRRITRAKGSWSLCRKVGLALCAALVMGAVDGRPAQAMQLASGSYTGNGMASHTIRGVGFRPDAVIIKAHAPQLAVMRTATMSGDAAKHLAAATALQSARIMSLDGDGFSVGAHAEVNQTGITYSWVAFRDDGAGDFRVGSYRGSGTDNRNIGALGFEPSYALVMAEGARRAVQRSSAMAGDYSLQFDSTGPVANCIQALQADGFQLGKDGRVNASGMTYHYVAWKATAGTMRVGSYTGNDRDHRSMAGVGFGPDYLIVKASVNEMAVHRSASLAGDTTLTYSARAPLADAIQALEADGFQVGTANTVNGVKATYFWVAFHSSGDATPVPALAITSVNGGSEPVAGTGFSVIVQSRDPGGISRKVTSPTSVSLRLKMGSGPLGGTLTGIIPAGASEVTITGVTYTKAESGVILTASRTSGDTLMPGDSEPLTVKPGAIAIYAVSLSSPQPAGATFAVAVTAQDQFANPVTTDSSTVVTLTASSGHVRFDANADGMFGDSMKALNAGAVSMHARGTTAETTTVTATDANGRTGSAPLTVTAGSASTLAFTTQPRAATAGNPIPGPPTVAVRDGFGNTVTSSKASITVALGANPGGGALAGTASRSANEGIASFDDLTIGKPGSGYTLIASSLGVAGATSNAFTIGAAAGVISGRVTRASDGAALAGAIVDALQTGAVKGSTTSGADGIYTIADLPAGSYDARASAAGYQSQTRAGISVTAGSAATADFGLTQLLGPSIRITSPAPGAALTGPIVLVRGEAQAPAGTPAGVAVNGMPGVVENGRFATLVPVDTSVVSLTATLNGLTGTLATHTIDITPSPPTGEPQVQLQAFPPGGPAPLSVTFHLSSRVEVRQIALDADDDGVIDVQGPTVDGVSMTYQRPGVYVANAQVTDSQGQTHTAVTFVHVVAPAALDAQLQAIWSSFKDAVRAGDLARASGLLHSSTRAAYQAQLAALSQAALADIDQIMTNIQLVKIGPGGAQYEMLRQDAGQLLSFAVWFQIDEDGVWRLRRF